MTIDTRQQLLTTINSQITLNGTGAITGPILNNVLDTMVNSSLFYTGTWSQYTSYSTLDVVIYGGTSYTAISANVNVIPSANPSVWTPFVTSSSLPGGIANSVQYNNGANGFAGLSTFTFNGTTLSAPALSLTAALPVASGGTGLTTLTTANNALYSTSGTALTAGTLPVAAGGTGATTLTANNVLLGNGTSAVQFVAPGTSGNVLKSNGTTWTSAAGGGITSITAGTGLSGGTITTSGTIALVTTLGAVGTYAFCASVSGTTLFTAGSTYAGSTLYYAGLAQYTQSGTVSCNTYTWNSANIANALVSPSGTWQAMGTVAGSAANGSATLFIRVA